MALGWITVVNSSYGEGIRISLASGASVEEFRNTAKHWYLAEELRLVDEWYDWSLKTPGLGDLRILQRSFGDKEYVAAIAHFPKGQWEFATAILE